MKRLLLVVLVLLLLPVATFAQSPKDFIVNLPTCGEVRGSNISWKSGNFGWFITYSISTTRSANLCSMWVSATGRIEGIADSGISDSGVWNATATRAISIPSPNTWNSIGGHGWGWIVVFPVIVWSGLPDTLSEATITAEEWPTAWPPEEEGGGGGEEEEPEESANCPPGNPGCACPLLVDLSHDGFHLTSVDDGVLFDIDGDGNLDRMAWTRAHSDDAWLAMDRNGNGKIDDGTELFGNFTPGHPNPRTTTPNGFEALKFLESGLYGTPLPDRLINAYDAAFSRLLLWTDRNHDGISQANELTAVSSSSLRAIETDYQLSKKRDPNGNLFTQRAKGHFEDGAYFIYDVWLGRAR